jgi:hypothetical protein
VVRTADLRQQLSILYEEVEPNVDGVEHAHVPQEVTGEHLRGEEAAGGRGTGKGDRGRARKGVN